MFGRGIIFTFRSIIKTAEKYLECKFYPFCRCTLLIYFSFHRSDSDKQSFKNKQDPCILDKSMALVITEKSCYTVPFTSSSSSSSSSIVPGISMIGFNFLKDLTIRTLLSIEVEIMMEYEWNLRRQKVVQVYKRVKSTESVSQIDATRFQSPHFT